jgi:hypothetical protein
MEKWGLPEKWGYQTWTQNSKDWTAQGRVMQVAAAGRHVTCELWRTERAFLQTVTIRIIRTEHLFE